MIHIKKYLHRSFATLVSCCLLLHCMAVCQSAQAQCTIPVTHLFGTEQIGCTEVTVTPEDDAGSLNFCGMGPYFPGDNPGGSYTFTFSPPVSGVSIDLNGINNWAAFAEEASFEVNGVFYPITVPGVVNSCAQLCIILPNGRVSTPGGNGAPCAWEGQPINETITTLKIENVVTLGNPAGFIFSLRFCEACCPTNAGVLTGSLLQLCIPQVASFSPATQTNLESGDLLQYVLYTNANDPEGSILVTSNTPAFSFNPGSMQTGVTYYLAAMAGNEVNGNVDLNDPCLDFSNAIEVSWDPQPTVSFSVADPSVCVGNCLTFNVVLSGTPPFSLTYTTGSGGPQTQAFNASSATLQVCLPAGTPPGLVTLSALSLTDANCVCD